MKNDQYLNLCLQQAAKSSLHFRHGSVVVKGGKVVGQGFNAYRSGYDGGALKTGQLSTTASPVDAIADYKRKRKSKPDICTPSANTFIPFEKASGGGGHSANVCLTMHSEMMAINSALAASSTLAASTVSHIKPDDYETARLNPTSSVSASRPWDRRFNNVPARLRTKSGVLKPVHLNATARQKANGNQNQNQKKGNKNNGNKTNKNKPTSPLGPKDSSKTATPVSGYVARRDADTNAEKGTLKSRVLIPKGRVNQASQKLRDRMKHPRLVGADIYVARLSNTRTTMPQKSRDPVDRRNLILPDAAIPLRTGSLYDELMCKGPKESESSVPDDDSTPVHSAVDSRPCYRCISYMHSVGIKRVFWTNSDGNWEGAKVRDLVNMLEGSDGTEGDGIANSGVFVTKHEVLMLRRMMSPAG